MFDPSTYVARRRRLIEQEPPTSGLVLLLGNERSPMNYAANPYPFRQDSTFLYYFGPAVPDLYGLIDLDEGTSTLYGTAPGLEDVIWTGEPNVLEECAELSGVDAVAPPSALDDRLTAAIKNDREIHFLPPYRAEHRHDLEDLVGIRASRLDTYASESLIRAVVRDRSTKSDREVQEIEEALEVTTRLHEYAMHHATRGTTEREIAGALAGIAASHGGMLSFRPTCSVHGEVLHNFSYENVLQDGDLLLVDAGGTSEMGYAGDITRTLPVGGSFTARQQALYEAVLDVQRTTIEAMAPGVPFREVHMIACRRLADHLIEIGLMEGNAEEAVEAGAHALFFPHGLGHMMGLDAHDMENLGEEHVGYGEGYTRAEQFGLHTLRLARPLRPGFVVTVEPGCYFIPHLIEHWRSENRHADFIDYDVAEQYLGLGGIRIEDDVLVTEDGARLLGPSIPKDPADVEAMVGSAGK